MMSSSWLHIHKLGNSDMDKFKHFLRKHSLILLSGSGIVFGLILGLILKACHLSQPAKDLVGFPGELFLRAFQMLILPSIIVSLIASSSTLNLKANGKVAMRAFTYFFLTSMFNTFLGVLLVVTIRPGSSDNLQHTVRQIGPGVGGAGMSQMAAMMAMMGGGGGGDGKMKAPSMMENMMDLWRNIVPDNMFTTLFESTGTVYEPIPLNATFFVHQKKLIKRPGTNLLGVIALALIFGCVLSTLKEQAAILVQVVKVFELVLKKLLRSAIWVMPIGVASLIAAKMLQISNTGNIVGLLALFIVTVVVGIFVYQLVFLQVMYYLILHKNPYKFYMDMLPAAAAGFASQSSSVAFPVTLQCLDERTKIDFRISRFVIPLGVIVNMDGTALFVTIASVYMAQLSDVSLSFMDYMTVCMSASAISIAAAAVPSASVMLIAVILTSIGVPPNNIGLLFAVDWLLDRLRTTNNILGDCYGAAIVQHLSRNELKDTADGHDSMAVSTTEFTEAHDTELDEVELK